MKSNELSRMYKKKKIITRELLNPICLPTIMYKMKNIHANGCSERGSDHVSSTANTNKCGIITEQVKRFLKNLEHSPEMTTLLHRQEKILLQLDELRQQMISLKADLGSNTKGVAEVLQSTFVSPIEVTKFPEIIINASSTNTPYSLLLIQNLCKHAFNLQLSSHLHSSVVFHENITKFLQSFKSFPADNKPVISIRLIWKNIGPHTELMITQTPIVGEVNILRYFSRMIPNILKYETLENYYDIDSILDMCHSFVMSKVKADHTKLLQCLTSKLGKNNWICGTTSISIADIAAYSVIKQSGFTELAQNLSRWFQRCETSV